MTTNFKEEIKLKYLQTERVVNDTTSFRSENYDLTLLPNQVIRIVKRDKGASEYFIFPSNVDYFKIK